ncbi:MAG: DUF2934 domain-containing protein [Halothiobacillus sp.]|jgi:hypothetical protein|nr:DUF2934 domain-containing protein [Halothiobacillus sp.]
MTTAKATTANKKKSAVNGSSSFPKENTSSHADGQSAEYIATGAYYMAEARGFIPGHEVEDWLEAERQRSVK